MNILIIERVAEPQRYFSAKSAARSPIEPCIYERCFLFGVEFLKELINCLLFHISFVNNSVPFQILHYQSIADLALS